MSLRGYDLGPPVTIESPASILQQNCDHEIERWIAENHNRHEGDKYDATGDLCADFWATQLRAHDKGIETKLHAPRGRR